MGLTHLTVEASTMTPEQAQAAGRLIPLIAQTDASTRGFLVGAAMIAVAAVLVLVALTVKHDELAAREAVQGAHID